MIQPGKIVIKTSGVPTKVFKHQDNEHTNNDVRITVIINRNRLPAKQR